MPDTTARPHLVLIRHGETEWSRTGRHTGRTDVPLSAAGVRQAELLGRRLRKMTFSMVLTSPLGRALETCRIAGFGDVAIIEPDLQEWDYGVFEGRTSDEIRTEIPGWTIWTAKVEGGESVEDIGRRADRVIARVQGVDGMVALFSHGHMLRILAARWLGLPPRDGALFELDTATVSRLGWERETRVIELWNGGSHLAV
jgi:broad specificity phosphatase PhoE